MNNISNKHTHNDIMMMMMIIVTRLISLLFQINTHIICRKQIHFLLLLLCYVISNTIISLHNLLDENITATKKRDFRLFFFFKSIIIQ